MKKTDAIYGIYLVVILILAAYFSVQIIEGNFKEFAFNLPFTGKYTLVGLPRLENMSVSCPCKNICNESSGCEIRYTKNSDDPLLSYELVPNAEQVYDGNGICVKWFVEKINSYGFRDYEYSVVKPNKTFRIVVLGDSYTFGQGVELNETYSKVLERLLNGRDDGWKYEVLNFGVPGYNAAEKVEILKAKAMKFNPDLIIFQYLGDDIVNITEQKIFLESKIDEYKKNENKSVITRFESEYIETNAWWEYWNRLEKTSFDDVWRAVEHAFRELNSTVQNHVMLLNLREAGPGFPRLVYVSQKYNWTFVDFQIDKYPPESWLICPQEFHPNPTFHGLIAEEIYKGIVANKLLPQ